MKDNYILSSTQYYSIHCKKFQSLDSIDHSVQYTVLWIIKHTEPHSLNDVIFNNGNFTQKKTPDISILHTLIYIFIETTTKKMLK